TPGQEIALHALGQTGTRSGDSFPRHNPGPATHARRPSSGGQGGNDQVIAAPPSSVEIPVSEDRRSISGERDARADGNADCRPRGVACKWLAQALDSVTENLAHKRCRCKTTQRAAEEAAVSGLRRTGGRNASRLTCRPGPVGKRRPH